MCALSARARSFCQLRAWLRSLEESVCKAVCLVFRNLVTMQEDNSGFAVLLEMLAELYQKQPKIGYHLLYYLKARCLGDRRTLNN